MGKPTGFMEYERKDKTAEAPLERIRHFREFYTPLSKEEQEVQGARCMACGVPFCQSGLNLMGMASGCPLHNLVPEWNDLIYNGNWEEAYYRLVKTNNFPGRRRITASSRRITSRNLRPGSARLSARMPAPAGLTKSLWQQRVMSTPLLKTPLRKDMQRRVRPRCAPGKRWRSSGAVRRGWRRRTY